MAYLYSFLCLVMSSGLTTHMLLLFRLSMFQLPNLPVKEIFSYSFPFPYNSSLLDSSLPPFPVFVEPDSPIHIAFFLFTSIVIGIQFEIFFTIPTWSELFNLPIEHCGTEMDESRHQCFLLLLHLGNTL